MKRIKRFIYSMLYRHHDNMTIQYREWFEDANLDGDHIGMVKCDKLFVKHLEKSEKYYAKLKELDT